LIALEEELQKKPAKTEKRVIFRNQRVPPISNSFQACNALVKEESYKTKYSKKTHIQHQNPLKTRGNAFPLVRDYS